MHQAPENTLCQAPQQSTAAHIRDYAGFLHMMTRRCDKQSPKTASTFTWSPIFSESEITSPVTNNHQTKHVTISEWPPEFVETCTAPVTTPDTLRTDVAVRTSLANRGTDCASACSVAQAWRLVTDCVYSVPGKHAEMNELLELVQRDGPEPGRDTEAIVLISCVTLCSSVA